MRKPKQPRPVARELPTADIDKILRSIGKKIKTKRKAIGSLQAFSYHLNFSQSTIRNYEAGGDMLLSNFLKVLHGLGVKPKDFFKELRK